VSRLEDEHPETLATLSAAAVPVGAAGQLLINGLVNDLDPCLAGDPPEALSTLLAKKLAENGGRPLAAGRADALKAVLVGGSAEASGTLSGPLGTLFDRWIRPLGTLFVRGLEKARSKTLTDGLTDVLGSAEGLTHISSLDAGATAGVEACSSHGATFLPFFTGEPKSFTVSPKMFIVL